MTMVSPRRRWLEVIVVTMLLGVFGSVTYLNLNAEKRLLHQKALFFELQILRDAINLYKVVNHKNPATLLTLATEVYNLPGDETTHTYVQGSPFDSTGAVHDPFGHDYKYDPTTGWLKSTTQGYEFW